MSEDKPSPWLVIISPLMLFVSGAWTLASIMPFWFSPQVRTYMLLTVTAANISFLITLLLAMFIHTEAKSAKQLRRLMLYSFTIGIVTLSIVIILFTTSYLIGYQQSPPFVVD